MEIKKATFKNNQAWLSIWSDGNYMGTWHIVDEALVRMLKEADLDSYELKIEGKDIKNNQEKIK